MKAILLLTLLSWVYLSPLPAQSQEKKEKAARLAEEFQATKTLVESHQFRIDIDRVYPQGGRDVSRFNPRGEIVIDDTIAKGNLPFFGRAYSLPYGEGGGIEFDGPVKERKVKIVEKKKKKVIRYEFAVTGKNDNYKLDINITAGGGCYINLISNNRAQISYSGNLSAPKNP